MCVLINNLAKIVTCNELKFGEKDNIPRISCNVTKNYFFERHVRRRDPVILTNCTDSWKAKHWSFEGIM